MSKCVICSKMYHPDFCIEKVIRGDKVISCLFCHLDKKVLTIEDENGKMIKKVSKKEAHKEYLEYLTELSRDPKIHSVLVKGNKK